jgi:hypothetical protein
VYLDGERQVHEINEALGKLVDIWLVAINQNGGFTKVQGWQKKPTQKTQKNHLKNPLKMFFFGFFTFFYFL